PERAAGGPGPRALVAPAAGRTGGRFRHATEPGRNPRGRRAGPARDRGAPGAAARDPHAGAVPRAVAPADRRGAGDLAEHGGQPHPRSVRVAAQGAPAAPGCRSGRRLVKLSDTGVLTSDGGRGRGAAYRCPRAPVARRRAEHGAPADAPGAVAPAHTASATTWAPAACRAVGRLRACGAGVGPRTFEPVEPAVARRVRCLREPWCHVRRGQSRRTLHPCVMDPIET